MEWGRATVIATTVQSTHPFAYIARLHQECNDGIYHQIALCRILKECKGCRQVHQVYAL
jgi:hypothetical protein